MVDTEEKQWLRRWSIRGFLSETCHLTEALCSKIWACFLFLFLSLWKERWISKFMQQLEPENHTVQKLHVN